ncbi:hypothetical protein FHW17_004001 [Phyllobacterium sp. P30BS-XVII]|nr:hypothetical protein [Phyllobacterium sp. P30BS-XVII]
MYELDTQRNFERALRRACVVFIVAIIVKTIVGFISHPEAVVGSVGILFAYKLPYALTTFILLALGIITAFCLYFSWNWKEIVLKFPSTWAAQRDPVKTKEELFFGFSELYVSAVTVVLIFLSLLSLDIIWSILK